MSSEIRIYVADLAAYNGGRLHGVWINACDEIGDIQEQISRMLKNSPEESAEEYAIHDYEGFEGCNISEYEGVESVSEKAVFIEEHGALGAALLDHFDNIEEAESAIGENYHGEYSSLADYAQEITEQTTTIPKHLEFYIDYEAMARDMDLNGDIFVIELGHEQVHVFWHQ